MRQSNTAIRAMKKDIKVQLVIPPSYRPDTRMAKYAKWPQPLGILSVGTYLKRENPNVHLELLDANNVLTIEKLKEKLDADIVGITTTAGGYLYALEIAEEAKEKGSRVVLGGPTATALAKEILTYHPYVDCVICYDGEIAFSKYVKGISLNEIENLVYRVDGKIKENPVKQTDLGKLPVTDRSLLDMEVYFKNSKDEEFSICDPFKRPVNIYSQKGCVWRAEEESGCIFCSIQDLGLRQRPPDKVWAEIQRLVEEYRVDFIWDAADNFAGDKEWFQRFANSKPKGLQIRYTNYVDAKSIDRETARLLAESGCCSVFVGMESGNPRSLNSMNKRCGVADNLNAMKMLKEYGIGVVIGVVVGAPGENKWSILRTLRFLNRMRKFDNFDRIEWGALIPLPGSKASRMLREHPKLADKYKTFGDWNYLWDMKEMIDDWFRFFCKIEFEEIVELQKKIQKHVPYQMTAYQRRSWSGTPTKIFT